MYEHEAPVFSSRWSIDGTKIISGGADNQVKIFDLATQQNKLDNMILPLNQLDTLNVVQQILKLLLVDHGIKH